MAMGGGVKIMKLKKNAIPFLNHGKGFFPVLACDGGEFDDALVESALGIEELGLDGIELIFQGEEIVFAGEFEVDLILCICDTGAKGGGTFLKDLDGFLGGKDFGKGLHDIGAEFGFIVRAIAKIT